MKESKAMPGDIYVVTNDCLRKVKAKGGYKDAGVGLVPPVKIGRATRFTNRVANLNSAVYDDFKLHLVLHSQHMVQSEDDLHEYFRDCQIKTDKLKSPTEFFAGPLEDILRRARKYAKGHGLEIKHDYGLEGEVLGRSSSSMERALNAKTKATTLKVGLQKGKCRPKSHDGKANPDEIEFTYRMKGGVVIKGRKVSGGFLVYKNSPVLKPVPCFNTHCKSERRLRDKLVAEGVISDGKLKCDYVFNTPSAAAGVMRGSSINGPKNWKAKDGRSYGEIFGS